MVTLVALPLVSRLELVHIALLYLLSVVVLAIWSGRSAAIFGALFGSVCFAHVFVPPKFSLAINQLSYLITALEMLIVALLTGHLTAGLRQKAEEAARREQMLRSAYGLAADLAGASTLQDALRSLLHCLESLPGGLQYAIFLNDDTQRLRLAGREDLPAGIDFDTAKAARDAGTRVVREARGYRSAYFPLQAISGSHGVIAVARLPQETDALEEQRFEMLASLVAVTLERVHFADLARNATLKAEAEQLRSSILSALSHDIRTPLTALVGVSEALAGSQPALSGAQSEMARELNELAGQMSDMVGNLLDMARLQSGRLRLRREWQPIEDVIGTSLRQIRRRHPGRVIRVSVPEDFPLVEFDTVLIERVLCNLLENSIKFAPDGEILLQTFERGHDVAIAVLDEGVGILAGTEEKIFEPFLQVRSESSTHGVGLGLAICRTIVLAHDGRIWAENRREGGARITFTLPKGNAPEAEEAPNEEGFPA